MSVMVRRILLRGQKNDSKMAAVDSRTQAERALNNSVPRIRPKASFRLRKLYILHFLLIPPTHVENKLLSGDIPQSKT